jgi:hypothetical protein
MPNAVQIELDEETLLTIIPCVSLSRDRDKPTVQIWVEAEDGAFIVNLEEWTNIDAAVRKLLIQRGSQ